MRGGAAFFQNMRARALVQQCDCHPDQLLKDVLESSLRIHPTPSVPFHPLSNVDPPVGGFVAGHPGLRLLQSVGHRRNFESIDVFRSWDAADARRVEDKAAEFDSIWEGLERDHVEVLCLTEDALKRVKEWSERHPPEDIAQKVRPNADDGLWEHQRKAVAAFLEKQRGILEMATGTGKTRTALHLCRRLVQMKSIDSVIVTTYGTDLLDQWAKELAVLADTLGYTLTRRYGGEDTSHYFSARPGKKILLCARGQLGPVLRGLSRQKRERLFLIHDEVHKLGSEGNREKLDGSEDGII